MLSGWVNTRGPLGQFYSFREIGDGWSAGVVDDSQIDPGVCKHTHYRIFAANKYQNVDGPNAWYMTLTGAREDAFEFVLKIIRDTARAKARGERP